MENRLRNNKFALLLILFINKHLYGMELPEEKLIEEISCVLKMMHSTDDVSEREKEIIKDIFLREFRDHEVFSIVQEYSPDDIFDLLIDKSNSNLPGILRDKLVTRCHDLYHRKEINLTPSLGIVKVFIRSKSSNKLAKLPVSIGQGAVIGPKCILTAKHVLHSVEEYKGKNDLSELLDSNCLPDDYKAGEEWDSVSFFFLPQIDDPTKDKFYEISGYSAVNQSGEIDVACAHTSKK